jgi:glycosyltransferase involved in cell wall biosynthesis
MGEIAIVCAAGIISGKEIMVLELAFGLQKESRAVEIVMSSWGAREFRERGSRTGLPVHVMRLGFISATLNAPSLYMTAHQFLHWPGLIARYRRFLKAVKPRRVIQTNWQHSLLLLPLLRSDRDLLWSHEVIPNKPQYRKVFGWLAKRIGHFVAVSQAVARSLERVGVPPGQISVIYNGIADPLESRELERSKVDRQVIGIVGQIAPWKGHDDLLEAFSIVAVSLPRAELHVFGRGEPTYEASLKARASFLGIADRIVWHGFLSRPRQIYEQMDVCAVPSRSQDALPTVAIEAAFFGIPVVASRRGGLPEIIMDGKTGRLIDAQQPAQLASSLMGLLESKTLRDEMGGQARRGAMERFSRERFVREFAALLDANQTFHRGP